MIKLIIISKRTYSHFQITSFERGHECLECYQAQRKISLPFSWEWDFMSNKPIYEFVLIPYYAWYIISCIYLQALIAISRYYGTNGPYSLAEGHRTCTCMYHH